MGHAKPTTSAWRKSSRCDSGYCLEVAWRTGGVAVRDNTVPEVQLSFDRTSWAELVQSIRSDQFVR
ncbi:MAG TPA: DUF397 domain-containing protein [Natronosporangium sp.]